MLDKLRTMNYKIIYALFLGCFLLSTTLNGQTIYGQVYDSSINTPLEGATVYLNGTSLGTISNSDGRFLLKTDRIINASLIISYLGYKTVIIHNPYGIKKLNIVLEPEYDSLDEITVVSDTWNREKKLREFKKQFLGESRPGKGCIILNEDDLDLEFIEGNATLVASSDVPLQIRNNVLGYSISYSLTNFEAKYDSPDRNTPFCRYVYYEGHSYYKDLTQNPKALTTYKVQREDTYRGSVMHFLRALTQDSLKQQGFELFNGSSKIAQSRVFLMHKNGDNHVVKFKRNFNLSHRGGNQSLVIVKDKETPIVIYSDGSYAPAQNLEFNGELSFERVGNALPLDYGNVVVLKD